MKRQIFVDFRGSDHIWLARNHRGLNLTGLHPCTLALISPSKFKVLDNWELSVLNTSYDIAAGQLINDGFLIVKVVPSVKEKLDRVVEAAQNFFKKPNETKLEARFPKDMGYRPFGGEYSNSPLNPDQVESFTVSPPAITPSKVISASGRILCENMLSSYESFELLAEGVTTELASQLSQTKVNTLRGAFHRWSRLQLNYSRPKDETVETVAGLPFEKQPKPRAAQTISSSAGILITPNNTSSSISRPINTP